ncbi:MAG: hypothetical protein IIB06_06620 [Bacteroidetes bacterium]|nr:hypothetical protein [Bacteroidota bacterium]
MRNILCIVFSIVILLGCNKNEERTAIENLLIGEWKLVSFVNELDGTSINEEDFDFIINFSRSIIINFKEDYSIDGNTTTNDLFGTYTLNNSETVLIFLTFGSNTEVGESDWGWLFLEKLQLNYNSQTQHIESDFEVSGDVLKLYYSNVEFMRFLRL